MRKRFSTRALSGGTDALNAYNNKQLGLSCKNFSWHDFGILYTNDRKLFDINTHIQGFQKRPAAMRAGRRPQVCASWVGEES
jgi:hypothetical protein